MPRHKSRRKQEPLDTTKILKLGSPGEIKLDVHVSASDYSYKFGSLIVGMMDEQEVSDTFTAVFNPLSPNIYLFWEKKQDGKVQEIGTRDATCHVPFHILQTLYRTKLFFFIARSNVLQSGDNVIHIYINPSKFVTLHYASESYMNHQRKQMFELLKYFLNVEFYDYEENFLYEEKHAENIYNVMNNHYVPDSSDVPVSHDFLISSLRPYQSQAVLWMLKKENFSDVFDRNYHVLYARLKTEDGEELYFHKYGGFFVDHKYSSEEPIKGGILADEMGLGKTLEVLACIVMNPKHNTVGQVYAEHNQSSLTTINNPLPNQNKKRKMTSSDDENTDMSNSKVYGQDIQHTDQIECVCGSKNALKPDNKQILKCGKCGVIHHAECVLYIPDVSPKNYLCPYCWNENYAAVPSKATLIISPASILYQWKDEISKHIKKDCLKVFIYKGVDHHKFIHPSYLADYDIVLTSYETLKKELNYVGIPHVKQSYSLRHPKKFLTIPSPMCIIEWWRICLDEAQMVETGTTKMAIMARKLPSINRWCVTGTPIKKSVEDLYGLLLFLGAKPFNENRWWKEALWKPYINGNALNIAAVLNDIAWRTIKNQVLDQIQIPELQEIIYKLEFTPVETVFYNTENFRCKKSFKKQAGGFISLNVKLNSIDKQGINEVMSPLRNMQLACSVYNVRKNNERNRIIMKPKELLAYMVNGAKYECEETHRKMIMALNGLGGIYTLTQEFQTAVNVYQSALKSIEDNKENCRTDVTQQVHILFMLSEIVSKCDLNEIQIKSKFNSTVLNGMISDLTKHYMEKNKALVESSRKYVDEIQKEICVIMEDFKGKCDPYSHRWFEVLEDLGEEKEIFMRRCEEHLMDFRCNMNSIDPNLQSKTFKERISQLSEVTADIEITREKLIAFMKLVAAEPSDCDLTSAISCHLRPEGVTLKCGYCVTNDIFEQYEAKLYHIDVVANAPSEAASNADNVYSSSVKIRSDSDLTFFLRCIIKTCRQQDMLAPVEYGTTQLNILDAFKREFKYLRHLWMKRCEYIAKMDEIEMSKISMRLPGAGEAISDPPPPYIIFLDEIPYKADMYEEDSVAFRNHLGKRLGHLYYLQNLQKAENKDVPFEEFCPVCQQTLENKWAVLECGHSLCLTCLDVLNRTQAVKFKEYLGNVCHGIRCPVCRNYIDESDVYFIDKNKNEDIYDLLGDHSTKISAIIKCLLSISESDPTSKSLVFSSFTEVLSTLEKALIQNKIKYLNLSQKNYQENLKLFKERSGINVLLIPLSFGCSGLNITEANNVLLVEPTLDDSKRLQAIGRIHRIGQKRKTTVHRFVVSNSVEEKIYNLFANDNHSSSELTLQNINEMFQDA